MQPRSLRRAAQQTGHGTVLASGGFPGMCSVRCALPGRTAHSQTFPASCLVAKVIPGLPKEVSQQGMMDA